MHYAELLQSDEAPVDATTALQHTTWKPVTSLPLFIGESPRAHWVRVGIRNTEVRPLHFRMDTGHPSLESVDVWVIRNIQTLPDPILSLRLYDPYSARQVDHPTIAAGFSLEANETVLVLVRVSHHLPRVLDLQLAADIPAMHKDRLEAALSGGFSRDNGGDVAPCSGESETGGYGDLYYDRFLHCVCAVVCDELGATLIQRGIFQSPDV